VSGRRRDNIPAELRRLPQWVGWRWEERDGKRTKPPFTADGSRPASCDDPSTWSSFAAVAAGIEAGRLAGAGFQVKEGQGILGVDLDHCRDPRQGGIQPWAREIVDRLNSYTEVSPSGTGIRIFLRAIKPGPRCRKGKLEIYDRSRYFTVTGDWIRTTPATIEERQAQLDALYAELWPEKAASNGQRPATSGAGPTAWEVIALASRAKNSAKFEALMRGDTSDRGGDDSAADLALCNLIAFYSRDPAVIDQVMRQSGLMREKWERADYRERTIAAALENVTESYVPPRESRPSGTHASTTAEDDHEEPLGLGEIPPYPAEALPAAMRRMVETAGLPAALVGGAALAALAAAVGPEATLKYTETWQEWPILWVAQLGYSGVGKSPAQSIACAPLRDHDARVAPGYQASVDEWRRADSKTRGDRPPDPRLRADDITMEKLARYLGDRGSVLIDCDELSGFLRSMGQYKRGLGSDRSRFLTLWTGSPWSYSRVGTGDGVDLYIPRPVVVVCGGLQPGLHELLGGETDGLRGRWLPHLVAPSDTVSHARADTSGWNRLITDQLLPARGQARVWSLSGGAERAFVRAQARWKRQARDGETAGTSRALEKADVHLLRVALVLAEAEKPGQGGSVSAGVMEQAETLIDFTLDCWRALPEQGGLSLSIREEKLDQAVDRVADWVEQHGGETTARTLQRAHAGGVRTSADLDQVLQRYAARYPGTITQEKPDRGPMTTAVRAPRRQSVLRGTVTGDSSTGNTRGAARPSAEFRDDRETDQSETVDSGDSSSGGDSSGPPDPPVGRVRI
jgi:putative DNA primase/helicase